MRDFIQLMYPYVLLLLLAADVWLLVVYLHRGKKLREMDKSVTKSDKESAALPESILSSPEGALRALVEEEKLFLNKDVSRIMVMNRLKCSHADLTRMLNAIEPSLSFPDYIKRLRVHYAESLMKENPKALVKEVADASGFYSIRTFQRSFLEIMGISPKAYMRKLAKK